MLRDQTLNMPVLPLLPQLIITFWNMSIFPGSLYHAVNTITHHSVLFFSFSYHKISAWVRKQNWVLIKSLLQQYTVNKNTTTSYLPSSIFREILICKIQSGILLENAKSFPKGWPAVATYFQRADAIWHLKCYIPSSLGKDQLLIKLNSFLKGDLFTATNLLWSPVLNETAGSYIFLFVVVILNLSSWTIQELPGNVGSWVDF